MSPSGSVMSVNRAPLSGTVTVDLAIDTFASRQALTISSWFCTRMVQYRQPVAASSRLGLARLGRMPREHRSALHDKKGPGRRQAGQQVVGELAGHHCPLPRI
jgi:hypothetical protein